MNIKNKEAFVYVWSNLTKGSVYVGYHKGSQDDGYICSSQSGVFWADWDTDQWSREIIAEGSTEDMVNFEYAILQSMDLMDPLVYNNHNGKAIIDTEEVLRKKSIAKSGTNNPMFRGSLEITHIESGEVLGVFTGAYAMQDAGFDACNPHKVAQGKGGNKSFGRNLPDGTRERAAYTARYVNPTTKE